MASIEFLNIDDLIDNIADAIAEYPVEAEKALNRTGLALKKRISRKNSGIRYRPQKETKKIMEKARNWYKFNQLTSRSI